MIPANISTRFKYRIQKENGYQREYYEVIMEDYGEGNGGHSELEFINYNEIKLGSKNYYRKGYEPEDSQNSGNGGNPKFRSTLI